MPDNRRMNKITEKNQFCDPARYDTEVLGFFEELTAFDSSSALGFRFLGTRRLPGLPTRPLGSDGRVIVTLTGAITLQKGFKSNTIRIKKGQKIQCYSMLQPICGKRKIPLNFNPGRD
jgi:hypothetical protein